MLSKQHQSECVHRKPRDKKNEGGGGSEAQRREEQLTNPPTPNKLLKYLSGEDVHKKCMRLVSVVKDSGLMNYSISGMLNPIGKMPKTHCKKEFCNGFTEKKTNGL